MKLFQYKRAFLVSSAAGLLALAFVAGRVWAAGVPTTGALTYSGNLEDAAGVALTGSHNVQVTFWSTATGGTTPLCQTASAALTLEPQGRFTVTLPDTCATAVRGTPNVWAEVTADGLPLGRSKLGAVPYALESAAATQGAVILSGTTKVPAKVCSGKTTPGATAWTVYGSVYLTLKVDTSACGFTSVPNVVSSLAGNSAHWETKGGSSPYDVTATGFTIFVHTDDAAGTTPAIANGAGRVWHINWIAVGN